MNQVPRYFLALSLTIPLALIAASCGSSDSSDSADPQPASTTTVASVSVAPPHLDAATTTSAPTPTTQTPQTPTTSASIPTTQESQMLIDSIVTGGFHSCALLRAGNIFCWGSNINGQLGNGQIGNEREDDIVFSEVPVEVVGIDDATAIAEGGWHTCALRQTGEVFCWGSNWDGQLGNGRSTGDPRDNSEDSPLPVKVLDESDVTTIEAGGLHSCALHKDGTITCWGSNPYGELGNGQSTGDRDDTSADSAVPVKVVDISDATAIAVGGWNSCALHRTGEVSCWGSNSFGELGNGQSTGDPDDTSTDSAVPVKVLGISDATAIEVGGWHVCALHRTGEVSCWGRNRRDELGNGESPGERQLSDVPVKVLGISDATAIAAGGDHTCALHRDGTMSCWGSNSHGELGNGQSTSNPLDTSADSPVPVKVLGISDATAITAGGSHSCALLRTDEVACWGENRLGQLGNGESTGIRDDYSADSAVPVKVAGLPAETSTTASSSAATIPESQNTAVAISMAAEHSCALSQTGEVFCWGANWDSQLGNGQSTGDSDDSSADSLVPVQTLGISDAADVIAGGWHTCAIHQTGEVSCWGSNSFGELGNGQSTGDLEDHSADSPVPVKVVGISDAAAINMGLYHTCAVHQTGEVSCWGSNSYGELGNGQSTGNPRDTSADSPVPVKVVGISDATAIAVGLYHTCAVRQTGEVSCWGFNAFGQLGNGQGTGDPRDTSANSSVPIQAIGISDATDIVTGAGHTCAMHETGEVSCWGINDFSELDNILASDDYENIGFSAVPVKILDISDAEAIAAGAWHTCAIRQDSTISCWGGNYSGQLGSEPTEESDHSAVPVKVPDISDATAIAAGGAHTCAIHQDGTMSCWGDNTNGELGDGTTEGSSAPVKVVGFGG